MLGPSLTDGHVSGPCAVALPFIARDHMPHRGQRTREGRITDPRGITPLTAFVTRSVRRATPSSPRGPESRVAHEDAFDAMRDHILGLYDGVSATHSFADEQGAVFDCIPVEQQIGSTARLR